MGTKIILSEPTEFEAKKIAFKVYPLSAEKLLELLPVVGELEKLQNSKDLKTVIDKCVDVVLYIVKEDNPDLTKEALLKNLSLADYLKVIKSAMGETL